MNEEADFHFLRSLCYEKMGRITAALEDIDRTIELCPSDSRFLAQRGHLFFHQKLYKEACAALLRAIRVSPKNAELRCRYAEALWLAGRLAQAKLQMRECLRLEPHFHLFRLEADWLEIAGGGRGKHLRGVANMRRRRFKAAAKEFAESEVECGSPLSCRHLALAFDFLERRGK